MGGLRALFSAQSQVAYLSTTRGHLRRRKSGKSLRFQSQKSVDLSNIKLELIRNHRVPDSCSVTGMPQHFKDCLWRNGTWQPRLAACRKVVMQDSWCSKASGFRSQCQDTAGAGPSVLIFIGKRSHTEALITSTSKGFTTCPS